jgi:altronate dehydratase small subunit
MKKAIKMDEKDNVATALEGIVADEEVEVISPKQEIVQRLTVRDSLPLGHKIALANIPEGAVVTKYGASIGKASRDISVGNYVHIHNVGSNRLPLTEHMLSLK